LQFTVPEEYIEFLKDFPRTGVFDKNVFFAGIEPSPWASDGVEQLEVLYGSCGQASNDISSVRKQYLDQIPENLLAIGQVAGDNMVCIDLSGSSFGKIYVWDHEHRGGADHGLYLAANSFAAFVHSLYVGDYEPGDAKVISSTYSDEFKEMAENLIRNNPGKFR